jgi:uncharacterized protein YdcH (DUF465 family)
MANEQMFGDEDSPLRESPKFRRYMEEYQILDSQIVTLQDDRGNLCYDDMVKLTKLKKLKLAVRDEMESCRKSILTA